MGAIDKCTDALNRRIDATNVLLEGRWVGKSLLPFVSVALPGSQTKKLTQKKYSSQTFLHPWFGEKLLEINIDTRYL